MSEMSQTADHLVVIGRGRLIADTSVAEFVRRASSDASVRVGTPRAEELREALSLRGTLVDRIGDDLLEVRGLTGEQIGEIALDARIVVSELTPQNASLEEAFMTLTGDSVEYRVSASDDDSNAQPAGAPA